MSKQYQCVSRTCRLDMNENMPGCLISVYGDNIARPTVCPLYEGKIKQEFRLLV